MIREIIINYIGSLASGVTLGIIGLVAYPIYKKKILSKQKNEQGDNIINNFDIKTQLVVNTTKKSKDLINKIIK